MRLFSGMKRFCSLCQKMTEHHPVHIDATSSRSLVGIPRQKREVCRPDSQPKLLVGYVLNPQ